MFHLKELTTYLDKVLNVAAFHDSSHNGLQVQNSGKVTRVACGVDASLEFFKAAAERGADLVVCHHGLSWGDSLKRITDLNYKRISFLINNDIALYACHLPLDAHPVHGNNALICRALGLRGLRKFGEYHGSTIGFMGRLPTPMKYGDFKKRVEGAIATGFRSVDCGSRIVRTVAVISGNGSEIIEEACRKGADVYVTGEATLSAVNTARDCGINAIFAGHYATERFGVESVARLLKRQFKLASEFVSISITF